MESTVSITVVVHVVCQTTVTEQQENALEDVNPDGKDFSVNKVMFVLYGLRIEKELYRK